MKRDRRERDLDDEIASHLRMAVEDRLAEGDDPGGAQRAARRQFGNVGLVKEVTRDVWGWNGFGSEFRSAWRNVKARRLRGALAVVLLGVVIGANTVIFSVADSLVLTRVTYRDPDSLVQIQRFNAQGAPSGEFLTPALLDAWRAQTDVFSALHGSFSKTVWLVENDRVEMIETADVTPGLIDMLGVVPRWGRPIIADDAAQRTPQVVLIGERLARERFGDPAAAVNQIVRTSGEPLLIAGVMGDEFRFPRAPIQIWRALDPRGELARSMAGTTSIARLRPGLTVEQAAKLVEERAASVGAEAGAPPTYAASVAPLTAATVVEQQRRLTLVLLGAALCLLLVACANVAGLELATAVQRSRTYAVHLAVGASRSALMRIALIEGAVLFGAAGILGVAIGRTATSVLVGSLPDSLVSRTVNPINFDERAALFLVAVTASAWLFTAAPLLRYVMRASLLDILRLESPTAIGSHAGSFIRRTLTATQIAVAVALMIGGLLYVRTYGSYVNFERGYDSTGLAVVNVSFPPQMSASIPPGLADTIAERIRGIDGVTSVTVGNSPNSMGAVFGPGRVSADGNDPGEERIGMAYFSVRPDYFSGLGIPLLAGRFFEPGEPRTNVIIGEALARRLWPGGDAVGHQLQWDRRTFTVVGVVGHVLSERNDPGEVPTVFQFYEPEQPPPPPRTEPPPSGLASVGVESALVRLETRARAADVLAAVRTLVPNGRVRMDFVDDVYARRFGDRLMAVRIVGGFGIFAFVISAAGLYAVMAFLVATRRREIGLRMALGAAPADVLRWVMSSSARLVIPGIVLGLIGAYAGARWIESQLFGVSPLDPSTYFIVATIVLAGAMLATWYPARQAARVDPIVVLRD